MVGTHPGRVGLLGVSGTNAGTILVNGASLTNKATFTRVSNATQRASASLLETVSSNVARFSYSSLYSKPVYLHEGVRTNICLQSEDLTTTWVGSNVVVSSSSEASPIDSVNFFKLSDNAVDNTHQREQPQTLSTSAAYTLSCYAKDAGDGVYLGLSIRANSATDWHTVYFDLAAGSVVFTDTVDFPSASSKIEDIGGGVYRCSITATSPAAITGANCALSISDSSSLTYSRA